MSGLATRVINRSIGNGFRVFFLRQDKKWLLISRCLYLCFTGSLPLARENMYAIANRPQSELPCCCWTRWTFTSRDFLLAYRALSWSWKSFFKVPLYRLSYTFTQDSLKDETHQWLPPMKWVWILPGGRCGNLDGCYSNRVSRRPFCAGYLLQTSWVAE